VEFLERTSKHEEKKAVINGESGTDEIITIKRLRGKGETGERETETAAGVFSLDFAAFTISP
jgi:hypothetical protein